MMTRRDYLQMTALGTAASIAGAAAEPPFVLPKLPYAYDALEPHIDARTMEIHHTKHHQTYVTNLNNAVSSDAALRQRTVEELLQGLEQLPPAIRTAVRNHGGGHANHSLFWQTLGPASRSGKPAGKLAAAVTRTFGGQAQLEDKLRAAAAAVFGSGWAWLSLDAKGGLVIGATPNQDSPLLAGHRPLLGIDVWEHAYYLKYQNRRPEYLAAITQVINWEFVSSRFDTLGG
jgi:superoxide dismutase, Fe-Mn family